MTKVMKLAIAVAAVTFGLMLLAGAPVGYAAGYVAGPFLIIGMVSGVIRIFKRGSAFWQIYANRDVALLVLNGIVLITLFVQP